MKKTTRLNPFNIHMSLQQCINFLHSEKFASGAEYHAITMRIKKWDKKKKETGYVDPVEMKKRIIEYANSDFGSYLRVRREIAGLSRFKLSRILRIPPATIHKWETGLRNISSEARLKRIAEFFEDGHFYEITKTRKLGD